MKRNDTMKQAMLAIAAARVVLGVIAIPLAPLLYQDHFVVLVLLRPTKEVLLAAGFLIRLDKIWWVPVVAAAVPLSILGVWQFYYLGRQYASEIRSGGLPWWAKKVLPPQKVKLMQRLLKKKGMKLVVLGRLAVFPSTVVAAAAGSGGVRTRQFLPADVAGGMLSIVEAIGLGFLLGEAYEQAGPWITAAGAAVLVVIAVIVARGLHNERDKERRRRAARKRTAGRAPKAARAASRS